MGATGTGPGGKPWVETEEDRLCAGVDTKGVVCGQPKHTHFGGTGTSTENPNCRGFVQPTTPLGVDPPKPVA